MKPVYALYKADVESPYYRESYLLKTSHLLIKINLNLCYQHSIKSNNPVIKIQTKMESTKQMQYKI